ncbi:MAG: FAD-binding protein [Bacteroidetes bacterium GWA2_32_17]|nr:MAG: FAD-binding protein [Bacteroidetes bacterium GWA2_32_17]
MSTLGIYDKLKIFSNYFEGDVYIDDTTRLLYSTDASAYREKPLAVIRPKNVSDIKKIIAFASENNVPIIPRTAGTSLAGQVIGNGIVIDVSKYLTKVLEINEKEKWVRIEPGVVLDELNKFLAPKGLFFGPETSTSSRCMLGGMVGNNSCGAHSLIYGSTRDHLLELKTILSDGSDATFKAISDEEFKVKCNGNKLENKIYQNINEILSSPENINEINNQYPDKRIHRRNTGYAIDVLSLSSPFIKNNEQFNFCKLLAGSEGTLAFTTEIKLNLVNLPPKETGLVCIHINSLEETFKANLVALKHNPTSIELMDKVILNLTKGNIEQNKNRFFIEGDPEALLIVEFAKDTREEIIEIAKNLEADMLKNGFGYYFPLIFGADTKKVWNLRKAGLGVLSTMPGDAKPVPVIEDTAVHPEVLPQYMKELNELFKKLNLKCIYYAHIATGEIHIRPILNLKKSKDVEMFHKIAFETAKLVKKYRGSLSGEHGDGRLRGEFIPYMLGEHCYTLLKQIKETWDPKHIFNPGKITNSLPMNSSLRYETDKADKKIETIFDFSQDLGILGSVEKCNGSADCRKSEIIGGTMCPSFMATKNENQTTRARANILREYLTNSKKQNPFAHKEIYEIMDLCLSCKACKSECPSGVDIAKMKAEFLQHYYDEYGTPFRTNMIAFSPRINAFGSNFSGIFNLFSNLGKSFIGFTSNRKIPKVYSKTLLKYYHKNEIAGQARNDESMDEIAGQARNDERTPSYRHSELVSESHKKVFLFADEFTNFNEPEIGIKAILLLNKLGYEVIIPKHVESGRTYFSKGLLRKAKIIAEQNVKYLSEIITANTSLIGIEPSAILAFRDEYPEIVEKSLVEKSKALAKNTLMIDEFIASEFSKGNIKAESFTSEPAEIKLHGHCQQKSIASTAPTLKMLTIPVNYKATEIPSGCCGMAGSFGYEKEHYKLSMQIGELVLFPEIRKTNSKTIIAATGTSCRCQIKDGTGRKAKHPVEILYDALAK